jgi:hypothetical protein
MLPHRFENHSSAFHRCKAFFGDNFGPKRFVGNGPQKRLLLKAKRLSVVNVEGFAVQKVLPAGGKQSERAAFFELPDFLDNVYIRGGFDYHARLFEIINAKVRLFAENPDFAFSFQSEPRRGYIGDTTIFKHDSGVANIFILGVNYAYPNCVNFDYPARGKRQNNIDVVNHNIKDNADVG